MLLVWRFTVPGEIKSFAAISLLLIRSAIRWMISSSRLVNGVSKGWRVSLDGMGARGA